MPHSKLRRFLFSAAIVAVLAGAGTAAEAGVYMGTYDPVDFNGTYTIDIPDPCIHSGTYWQANNGSCGFMTMGTAFTNVVSDGTGGDPLYTGALTFTPSDGVGQLLGIFVQNGIFQAPDTKLIKFTGASPATTDVWYLQFTSGQCGTANESPPCTFNPGSPSGSAAYTSIPFCIDCGSEITALAQPLDANPIGNVFIYVNGRASVPEPGTLALLAGALGAGWFARRRKTSAG